jgi:hypothetical protein
LFWKTLGVVAPDLIASGARHPSHLPHLTSLALVSTTHERPQYSFYRQGVADRDVDLPALLRRRPNRR